MSLLRAEDEQLIRGETIFGMHKFELVPIAQNGLDLLDASFSSQNSQSRDSYASTDLDELGRISKRKYGEPP